MVTGILGRGITQSIALKKIARIQKSQTQFGSQNSGHLNMARKQLKLPASSNVFLLKKEFPYLVTFTTFYSTLVLQIPFEIFEARCWGNDFPFPLWWDMFSSPLEGNVSGDRQGCTPIPTYPVMGNPYISPITRGYSWVISSPRIPRLNTS